MDSDVIIVGGSIAGNYLASLLAKKGIRTLVLEEHPAEKIGLPMHCTGIISQKITRIVDFPSDIILNRVRGAAIYAPSGKHVLMGSKNESPVIIDRAKFDRHFFEVATAEGAHYLTKTHVSSIKKSRSGVKVFTSQGTFEGNVIVGADGPMSVVAKTHGVYHDYIYGIQARVNLDFPADLTALHFNPYWKDFFAWIVPEGKGICRVGLATRQNPRQCFNYFLHTRGIRRSQFVSTHGGLIPIGIPGPQAFSRAILIGDAACQVKATTGGGVVMLTSAAQIAAPALVKAITQEDYSRTLLHEEYQVPCEETIGRELKIHYLIHSVLKRLSAHDWDRILKLYDATDIKYIFNLYGEMDFPMKFVLKLFAKARFFSLFLNLLGKNISILQDLIKIWKS